MTKENALVTQDENMVEVLKDSLYPDAKDESIKMVIAYCKARNLDPLQKPVHIVPFKQKDGTFRDVIMPGINLYRTQAANTGCLAGISEPTFGPLTSLEFGTGSETSTVKAPEWAKITVRRLLRDGTIGEFTHIEFFEEAVSLTGKGQPTTIWRKRPRGMLAKVAESQAIRKAFADLKIGGESAEEGFESEPYDSSSFDIASAALEAAKKGTANYKEFWLTLNAQQKVMIRKAFPHGLADIAQQADDARTVEAEDVEANK